MAGIWTKERRRKHSLRIKQLVKQGIYKKACSHPKVVEANRQRAIARNNDPAFKAKHKRACKIAMNRPDTRKKVLEAARGRDNTNQILAAKDPDRCRRVSIGQKRNWDNNPTRKVITSRFKEAWWAGLSVEDKRRLVEKIFQSNGISPNKTEKRLTKLLELLGYTYEFMGDGKVIVAGHCPDFIDRTRKEIIEFNGTYWHKNRKSDEQRLRDYTKKGYRCLAIYAEGVNRKSIKKIVLAVKLFRDKSRYGPICMATCS